MDFPTASTAVGFPRRIESIVSPISLTRTEAQDSS
jgi:hypothetical protein